MLQIREISAHQRLGLLDLEQFSALEVATSKREIEKKGARFVLEKMLSCPDINLSYSLQGKPAIEGRQERVSISHSHGILAVITNAREETGVDVELVRDKVVAIRHKFLNSNELTFAGEDVEKLITLWAAKEAMYKAYGLRQLDFRRDLAVLPFEGNAVHGDLSIGGYRRAFRMEREKLGNHILVYILNEVQVAHQPA